MGLYGIGKTNFYTAQTPQASKNTGTERVVFTNASDIGKALSSRKMNVNGVTVELSDEALQALFDARDQFFAHRDAESERYMVEFNSYVAKQQSEAYEDAAEDMAKALETARRIANGDIVPAQDEKKLLEYDDELYQMAKNAAMLHAMDEERKKHKSLYGDEEEREYTDPEAETAPEQKFGVEVEISLGDVPEVAGISEGMLE